MSTPENKTTQMTANEAAALTRFKALLPDASDLKLAQLGQKIAAERADDAFTSALTDMYAAEVLRRVQRDHKVPAGTDAWGR